MAKAADEPRDTGDTALDRMVRFGTALFAVKKDELPKRGEPKKAPHKKRATKPGRTTT
ncbi:MAG: hypothetical protein M3N13_05480 [Candidatus Eremiobacteraeota bacterium]|nr:hypothetical protein [Candidatus Eremiobacteraeota bacterium]